MGGSELDVAEGVEGKVNVTFPCNVHGQVDATSIPVLPYSRGRWDAALDLQVKMVSQKRNCSLSPKIGFL